MVRTRQPQLALSYPNPFAGSSTVESAVRVAQDVTLALIDVQGRPIRTIFEGALEANVRRSAPISAAGLASGTYILRMEGERFEVSETVTIAR